MLHYINLYIIYLGMIVLYIVLEYLVFFSTFSRLFKQASACQPPTREICCIGPGIMDSREKELYIMLDIMYYIYVYLNMFMYILKA